MILRPLLLSLIGCIAPALNAHEFWIDPVEYQVNVGEKIEAHFKVGSNFVAPKHGYVAQRSVRHEYSTDGVLADLPARSGDRPAMQLPNAPEGLVVLVHETTDSRLTYQEWDKFVAFLDNKHFVTAAARHLERNLPEKGFKESYRRHGKALVAVGKGAGQDFVTGMPLEVLANANPYTDDMSNGVPITIYKNGTAFSEPNMQIDVFERTPEGEISEQRFFTNGQMSVPVTPGNFYMVSYVELLEVDPVADGDPVWHSAWASLTFQVPN